MRRFKVNDEDDPYREFNAEAEAYQEQVKRLEQERRITSFKQMLAHMAGEDLPAADYDWIASIEPAGLRSDDESVSVATHKRWAVFEDRHPRLKAIPPSERAELAKQAHPGESWSELLYRLGDSRKGRTKP